MAIWFYFAILTVGGVSWKNRKVCLQLDVFGIFINFSIIANILIVIKSQIKYERDINIWKLCLCLNIDSEGGSYSYTKYRYARKVVLFAQRNSVYYTSSPYILFRRLFLLLNTLRLLLPLVADDLMMMSLHSFQLSPHNH